MSFYYTEGFLIARVFDVLLYTYLIFYSLFHNVKVTKNILFVIIFLLLTSIAFSISEVMRDYPKNSLFKVIQIIIAVSAGALFVHCNVNKRVLSLWKVAILFASFLFISQFVRAYLLGPENILELIFFMRLVPGSNNLGNSIVAFNIISVICALSYYKKTRQIRYIFISLCVIAMCLAYPSRQILLAHIILLILTFVGTYKVKRLLIFYILFIIMIVCVLYQLGIVDTITKRTQSDMSLGGSYVRLKQFALAWDFFSRFPFFGSELDPYPLLKSTNLFVFESAWSELAVRNGLFGLICIILALTFSLLQVNLSLAIFCLPMLVITIFNETLIEEELWFTIGILINICRNYVNKEINERSV